MPAKSDPRPIRGGKSESDHDRRARAIAEARVRFAYRRELGVRDGKARALRNLGG